MKRNWGKLLILLVALGLAAAFWPTTNEPSYQGKPLTHWLVTLVRTNNDPEAIAAVRAIGTNAVPTLLQCIEDSKPSPRRDWYYEHAIELSMKLHLLRYLSVEDPRWGRAYGATRGFWALGTSASNAIPALVAMLDKERQGIYAGLSLGAIGPIAVPMITNALAHCSTLGRYHALDGFSVLCTNGAAAIPAIINCLQDTSPAYRTSIRTMAAWQLGNVHSRPELVLPALTNLFNDSDSQVRQCAIRSAGQFGQEALWAVPVITLATNDPIREVRQAAFDALHLIDNRAIRELDVFRE